MLDRMDPPCHSGSHPRHRQSFAMADLTTRACRAWMATAVLVACALLVLLPAEAAAHVSGGAAARGWHRHGRDSGPGPRPPRGNQATAAPPASRQDHPECAAAGNVWPLLARARCWVINPTLALASHGDVAAWDTAGETSLAGVFQDAAAFNEDLNAYVWRAALPSFVVVERASTLTCAVRTGGRRLQSQLGRARAAKRRGGSLPPGAPQCTGRA